MTGQRRLSQAISEGDGISLIAVAADADAATAAEQGGAEGVVLHMRVPEVRDATGLPIIWRVDATPHEALTAGADALLLAAESLEHDSEHVERRWQEVHEIGLECVVEVRDADELELALERLDPEIFLLTVGEIDEDADPLDAVLELLPDVPAGKLAIAYVDVESRDEVLALERAGIDAVLVPAGNVTDLVGHQPVDV
jgi:indole-3-glycerol phosphate synthase